MTHAFGMQFDRRLRLAVGLLDGLAGRGLLDRSPLELRGNRRPCLLERLERGQQLPALVKQRLDRPAASRAMTQAQPQTLRRRQAAASDVGA